MTIAHIESNMARTRFSVTKALKRKQVNSNNSDVIENNVCFTEKKTGVILYPRKKALNLF